MQKIIMASVLCGCAAMGAEPEAREWKNTDGTVVKYRWSAPDKLEPGKSYPLILFFHGAGERGTDNTAQLKHGVTPILKGAGNLGEPCFLIAPQCPPGIWWNAIDPNHKQSNTKKQPDNVLGAVLALVEDTMKKQPIDPKRFYVTGLSMGGFATWDLLGKAPEKIAAAIPICGGGNAALAARFKDIPIWAFHGDADTVVPVKTTHDMIAALEKAGGKPKSTIYPGVQHNSWSQTYANPEVIKWMFAQRKN